MEKALGTKQSGWISSWGGREQKPNLLESSWASTMTTPLFRPCPLLQAFLLLEFVVVVFETEARYVAEAGL